MGDVYATGSDLPDSADIVVIGAGLVGLATAFYASRANLGRVVVLERGRDLADLTSAHSAEGFRLEWDAPENIAMVRESVDIFEHFADVVGIPGLDVGFVQNGYLFLSSPLGTARRRARLKERVAWCTKTGFRTSSIWTATRPGGASPLWGPTYRMRTSAPRTDLCRHGGGTRVRQGR